MSAGPLLLRSVPISRRPRHVLSSLLAFLPPPPSRQVWLLSLGHLRSASRLDTVVSLEGSHEELVFMFALLTLRMERHHR